MSDRAHRDHVLIVDDDASLCRLVEFQLEQAGIPCKACTTGKQALDSLEESLPTAVVLDLMLPDASGRDLLERFKAKDPDLSIVVVTGSDQISTAVDCMKAGATDFLQKPFDHPRLLASVRNAHERGLLSRRLREAKPNSGLTSIVGDSAPMRTAKELLSKAASSDVTVLIEGPSGTGKELFARATHDESQRALGPFIAVNCGAIPESLIESELFGYEKGAFSGADKSRVGLFEQADGGTLFLDEIGELGLDLQVRLLRVLTERKIRSVGSDAERKVDVRVVGATNRNLHEEAAAGRFREDLYYRLSVFPIALPSLAERNGDRLLLAQFFLERANQRYGKSLVFDSAALDNIDAFAWPGNVRQLENAIERAVVLSSGAEITPNHLPEVVVQGSPLGAAGVDTPPAPLSPVLDLAQTAEDIAPFAEEFKRILERALRLTGWNVQEAARRLGIGRATLYRKIQEFDLKRPQAASAGEEVL
ncbi:MAG: sigma-54-dependent transcriptional regulator [Planctomycetota bacterium]